MNTISPFRIKIPISQSMYLKCVERQTQCSMNQVKTVLLLFFFASKLHGQNYIQYQRTFNRIEDDVISQNYHLAINRLDSIYSNYEFIFAKHCIQALQICIAAQDSINANKWLARSFRQGIPIWYIRTNELTQKALTFSTTQQTVSNYDSLHSIYKTSINTAVSKVLDSLLDIDQKYTRKVNDGFVLLKPLYWLQWGINNQRQYKTLKQIIQTYGYPEEKMIGLPNLEDSMAFKKYLIFWGSSELRDSRMQIMLQHCYSTWHKIDLNFKDTLYANLCDGNMPPHQYAIVIRFMFPHKTKYIDANYFYTHHSDSTAIEIINKNRYSIGLNSVEQNERNTLINRERRKNKKANSEIMLE